MNTNKLLLSALAVSVMTPAIVAPIPTDAATYSKTFKDVPKTHPYYTMIHDMAKQGIISGYTDGTFKPNQTISRQHAALLINEVVDLPKSSSPTFNAPKDLPTSHVYFDDMKKLIGADLLNIDWSNKVYPSKGLTRGEMAKILAVAFELKATKKHPFKDVDTNNEFAPYISALYSNGITAGYEDGSFKPNETLTRQHYALFMYRAMNLKPTTTTPKPNVTVSPNMNISDFNKTIGTNPLFATGVTEANPYSWADSKYYRRAVTDGQKALEGTNLKFIEVVNGILIQEEGWVNRHAYGFLSSQVVMEAYDEQFMTLSFDFSNDNAVQVSKKLLENVFPNEFNINDAIDTKVEEGRAALARNDKYYGNYEVFNINGIEVKAGIAPTDLYRYFRIEITKK